MRGSIVALRLLIASSLIMLFVVASVVYGTSTAEPLKQANFTPSSTPNPNQPIDLLIDYETKYGNPSSAVTFNFELISSSTNTCASPNNYTITVSNTVLTPIYPTTINVLPGGRVGFTVRFNLPSNVNPGDQYTAMVTATCASNNGISDRELTTIIVAGNTPTHQATPPNGTPSSTAIPTIPASSATINPNQAIDLVVDADTKQGTPSSSISFFLQLTSSLANRCSDSNLYTITLSQTPLSSSFASQVTVAPGSSTGFTLRLTLPADAQVGTSYDVLIIATCNANSSINDREIITIIVGNRPPIITPTLGTPTPSATPNPSQPIDLLIDYETKVSAPGAIVAFNFRLLSSVTNTCASPNDYTISVINTNLIPLHANPIKVLPGGNVGFSIRFPIPSSATARDELEAVVITTCANNANISDRELIRIIIAHQSLYVPLLQR